MEKFRISLHAQEQMENRGINEEIVFDVLNNPDRIEIEFEDQLIYQKLIYFENEGTYLGRVFVNSSKIPNLVKTVYRTSKFGKYL